MNQIVNSIWPFLQNTKSVFYTFYRDMVEPVFSDSIPTAAVYFEKEHGKCVKFAFNEGFWNGLIYRDRCFVFSHETLHVLFDHGNRGSRFLNSLPKKDRSSKLLNVAQDISINHILQKHYVPDVSEKLAGMMCTIKNVFKDKSHLVAEGETFEYYYKKYLELFGLVDEKSLPDTLDHHSSEGTPEEVEDVLSDYFPEYGKIDEKEFLERLESGNQGFSTTNEGSISYTRFKKPKKSLSEHLKSFVKGKYKKPLPVTKNLWYGVNRRMDNVIGRGPYVLPVRKEIQREDPIAPLIVYCDVSGSVSGYSSEMMGHVKAIYDEGEIPIIPYVWAYNVKSVDLSSVNGTQIFGAMGGTVIKNVISHFVNNHMGDNGNVAVLTDGDYEDITNVDMGIDWSKWTFFYTPKHEKNHPKKSSAIVLDF